MARRRLPVKSGRNLSLPNSAEKDKGIYSLFCGRRWVRGRRAAGRGVSATTLGPAAQRRPSREGKNL